MESQWVSFRQNTFFFLGGKGLIYIIMHYVFNPMYRFINYKTVNDSEIE